MTSFKINGFLSEEMFDYEKDIQNRHKEYLELAAELNKLAHRIIYSIEVHASLNDLLLATLFTRQTASFQAFIVLIRKGLLTQSEIILRNILETSFIIGAIGKDGDFGKKFVFSENLSRKKALVRLSENYKKNGKEVDQETIDLIAELQKFIKDKNIKEFSIEQIAKIANLTDLYDTLYPLTSRAVHTSPRGLDKALVVNDQGELMSVDYGPVVEGFDMQLASAIDMTLYTMHEAANNFDYEVAEIEELRAKLKRLIDAE